MSKKRSVVSVGVLVVFGAVLFFASLVSAHCQIPCGIYNDEARVVLLEEHITTIEKSMKLIVQLSEEPLDHANQIVRWVNNKDQHADDFKDIVTEYFLQQRIKPVAAGDPESTAVYAKKLSLCHRMLVTVMKAKQSTDLAHVETLKQLVADFREVYF